MKRTFIKNLLRDIRKTLSRFLSIVIIIAVGVAFYAGVRATSPDMKISGDHYFKENNLMDFKIISTLGLSKADISEIGKQSGVTKVEGSYSIDAVVEKNEHLMVLNVNSLPAEDGINKIRLVQGRRAENNNEAVVEEGFLEENKYKIGDTIVLQSGNEKKIEDRLKNNEFIIVGTADSPLYVSLQRQLSSIGNGSVKGFVYILPNSFKGDVYTEAYVRSDSKESNNSLLDNNEYTSYMAGIEKSLKDLGLVRAEVRYTEILNEAEDKIKEAEDKLNSSKQEATDTFAKNYYELNIALDQLQMAKLAGMPGLEDQERALNDNIKKLKSEEERVNNDFREAEAEISKNKEKLKDIKKPEWYVLGRSANVGYETYRQDSDGIDNIGKVFPFIFFLVAALVSLTTMTRMVQENRMEIGTFKALGYSRLSITAHYLIYSLSASLIGSLIGISFGFRLFPSLIINAYATLYTIPDTITIFNNGIAIKASLIAMLFTTSAAVAATLEELKEAPASLLRPKSPKSGKRIFLERLPFIWKRLGFTKKVTARNIFRYKQRFFMTVIGIAACTGLMITGFGLKGAIVGAAEKQFSDIYKYDMVTTLTKDINNSEKGEMREEVLRDSNTKSILFTYTKNGSANTENSTSEDAHIVVSEDKAAFNDYINLTMKDKAFMLDDEGVIVTEKFSKLIKKKVGDTFEVTINDKVTKVKISAITEQYVQHYIYMSQEYYEKITGNTISYNSFYGRLNNTNEDAENKTSKALKSISGINSVSFKNNTKFDFNKTINSINSVVLILIVSAGILAFVVIYNLTNININERRRELATIKLLGFFNKELAAYIYRENIILTIIGSLFGILIGVFINKFIVSTAETNIMMFLKTINPIYFLYSIALTIIFSIIVNLTMYNRFDKIDMIESLKSAE